MAQTDISPTILALVVRKFRAAVSANARIGDLESGARTTEEAQEYAELLGEALSGALCNGEVYALLPDQRMYYNIAQSVLTPLLRDQHARIDIVCRKVQQNVLNAARLGVRPQETTANADRISGIIDEVSDAADFADVMPAIGPQLVNFALSAVDNSVFTNMDFMSGLGFEQKVIRVCENSPESCKWCKAMAANSPYRYEDVMSAGNDVWRRHVGCRCVIKTNWEDEAVYNGRIDTRKYMTDAEKRKRTNARRRELYREKNGTSSSGSSKTYYQMRKDMEAAGMSFPDTISPQGIRDAYNDWLDL